jgi:hypothetical protein
MKVQAAKLVSMALFQKKKSIQWHQVTSISQLFKETEDKFVKTGVLSFWQ